VQAWLEVLGAPWRGEELGGCAGDPSLCLTPHVAQPESRDAQGGRIDVRRVGGRLTDRA